MRPVTDEGDFHHLFSSVSIFSSSRSRRHLFFQTPRIAPRPTRTRPRKAKAPSQTAMFRYKMFPGVKSTGARGIRSCVDCSECSSHF
jgi:hypothetical protein